VLAEPCNPEWPSLPVVGCKYARALADEVDANARLPMTVAEIV
jgi:hypothetical protein